jgi:hypothetical protein
MKNTIKLVSEKLKKNLRLFGIDLIIFRDAFRGIGFYLSDYKKLKKQKGFDETFPLGKTFPIFGERFTESGKMSGHYFHQDLLVARKIYENKPLRHIDIGSRTDGFVAHVAVFRKIEIIDIRDQTSKTENIIFKRADLMQLPSNMTNAYDSISSLHAIEHFGLGRYGDPIDYNGYLKAIENITAMLQIGGTFYFSVPIGCQRIEFNAHRVFSVKYLLELFRKNFTITSFSYVNDGGDLFENVELNDSDIENNYGCNYGCGIFELTKI